MALRLVDGVAGGALASFTQSTEGETEQQDPFRHGEFSGDRARPAFRRPSRCGILSGHEHTTTISGWAANWQCRSCGKSTK
jgi:hypothetical protein